MRHLPLLLSFITGACNTLHLDKPTQDAIVSTLARLHMIAPLLAQGHQHFLERLPRYESIIVDLVQGILTDDDARAALLAAFASPAPAAVPPAVPPPQ